MKLLVLMCFSHIVYSFYFHPHTAAEEPLRKNEKIAGGSFYFLSEIVTTFESLEGCVFLARQAQPNQQCTGQGMLLGEGRGRECCVSQRSRTAPSTISAGAEVAER